MAAVPNSVCFGSHCVCLSGYASRNDGTLCKKREIGDVCSFDSDCSDAIENTLCLERRGAMGQHLCGCIMGYYQPLLNGDIISNNNTCTMRTIGDVCIHSSDCTSVIENGICFEGICGCIIGYHQNGTNVCDINQLGSPCSFNEQCSNAIPNSLCGNDSCRCNYGYFGDASLAFCQLREIGDNCTEHVDCYAAVNNSYCDSDEGSCQCELGYQISVGMSHCTKRRILDDCDTSMDCYSAVDYSHCSSNFTCICNLGYTANSMLDTCYKSRLPLCCGFVFNTKQHV